MALTGVGKREREGERGEVWERVERGTELVYACTMDWKSGEGDTSGMQLWLDRVGKGVCRVTSW